MKTVSLSPKITLSPSCACVEQPGTWNDSRWKLIWHSVQAPVMFILLSRTNNTNVCISSRSARPLTITELCIFLAGGRSQTPHRTLLCAMSQRRRRHEACSLDATLRRPICVRRQRIESSLCFWIALAIFWFHTQIGLRSAAVEHAYKYSTCPLNLNRLYVSPQRLQLGTLGPGLPVSYT